MDRDIEDDAASADDLRQRALEAGELAAECHGSDPAAEPDAVLLATLERAMRSLPRRTCEIFLAHRVDEYDYITIADITGLSVEQVTRHMAKAIVRVSRYLDGDERTSWQRWRQRQIRRWFR